MIELLDDDSIYTDEPIEFGRVLPNNALPPPEQLVLKTPIDKISFDLKRPLLQFYKDEAKELGVPYSRLMRAVLQNYATQIQAQNATKHSTETRPST